MLNVFVYLISMKYIFIFYKQLVLIKLERNVKSRSRENINSTKGSFAKTWYIYLSP